MSAAAQPKVVVLGGGFGGLEAAFSLRRTLGEGAGIRLVSDYDRFRFKPSTIYIPFGADPAKFEVPLRPPLAARDIAFLHGQVRNVDPAAKRVDVQQFEPTTMYLMEQAETGTFAEVPLRPSDDPLTPAEVDPDKPDGLRARHVAVVARRQAAPRCVRVYSAMPPHTPQSTRSWRLRCRRGRSLCGD